MNSWSAIRKRFQTKTAKRVKGKVLAGVELVGAGAALTRGAMLLEEATKQKVAPGHNNVYATDNGATLFKYETLASEEEGILTSEIIGYAILAICMVLFFIMFARAILKIKQMCGHKTNSKSNDDTDDDTIHKEKVNGNQESSIPSMERTLEDLNNSSIFNPTSKQAMEEAIKKARENYATLSLIKQNTNPQIS